MDSSIQDRDYLIVGNVKLVFAAIKQAVEPHLPAVTWATAGMSGQLRVQCWCLLLSAFYSSINHMPHNYWHGRKHGLVSPP